MIQQSTGLRDKRIISNETTLIISLQFILLCCVLEYWKPSSVLFVVLNFRTSQVMPLTRFQIYKSYFPEWYHGFAFCFIRRQQQKSQIKIFWIISNAKEQVSWHHATAAAEDLSFWKYHGCLDLQGNLVKSPPYLDVLV